MKVDEETFRTIIIAWVVVVTVGLGILLPYTVNIPTLPAFFYSTISKTGEGSTAPAFLAIPVETKNPEGLLVRYDFEEDLSRTFQVMDHSGNGMDAFFKGLFIKNGPGIIGGRSLSLSGTGYAYSPFNLAAGRTNVSFSVWFTEEDTSHNYRIAGSTSTSWPISGWIIGTHSSDLWDDSGDPIRIRESSLQGGPPAFNAWNHKVLVYNGTRVTEYLNGIPVSEYTASGKPVGSGGVMMLGSWQPFGQNYVGCIDDFRIYNRSLSASEVADLYSMANVPATPPSSAWVPFFGM
jgi:hypothetical protein